jgi:hypothetical protein
MIKRPVGRPLGSGKGRKMKSSSLSMMPEQWSKMDKLSGGKKHRSAWLRAMIDQHKDKQYERNTDTSRIVRKLQSLS